RRPSRARHRDREHCSRYPGRSDRPAHPDGRLMAVGPDATAIARSLETAARPEASGAAWRRLGRLKWGLGGAAVFLLIVASSASAPLVVAIKHRLAPPAWMEGGSREHLLGTDQVGRDLLSRVIWGGRVSLLAGASTVILSSIIGVCLGLAAGYFGGRVDWNIM